MTELFKKDTGRPGIAANPEKLLVTGNLGFVGRHFCSRYGGIGLAEGGNAVDLRDAKEVHSAVASLQPEAVLHLAAQSSVASSFSDPLSTIAVNFLGTLNLLEALSASRFQGTFVYVGSADVYGKVEEAELPTKETQPLRPRSPYAVSKVAAEAVCFQWSQTASFRVVLARPFNQIGPGQDGRFAIADFARQILEIKLGQRPPVLVTGDLDVTRDFTDVRDTVIAYNTLLGSGRNGDIYNICSGQERSIRSVIEGLLEIAGVTVELQVDMTRLRSSEQRRMVGDPSKISRELGWEARIPLQRTLTDILHDIERT